MSLLQLILMLHVFVYRNVTNAAARYWWDLHLISMTNWLYSVLWHHCLGCLCDLSNPLVAAKDLLQVTEDSRWCDATVCRGWHFHTLAFTDTDTQLVELCNEIRCLVFVSQVERQAQMLY